MTARKFAGWAALASAALLATAAPGQQAAGQQQAPGQQPAQAQPPRPQAAPAQPRPPGAQATPTPQGQAGGARAGGQAGNVDRLIGNVGPVCLKAPARECVDRGFAYADRSGDGRLSLAEAQEVEREVSAWTQSNAAKLAPEDRQRVVLGLVVVQSVGVPELFRGYDTNRDGLLSKEELLADVKLDQRPLPVVLGDPKSVDWNKLASRAGSAAPLLRRLFPM